MKYFHHFSMGTFARLHMTGRFVVGHRMFEKPSPYWKARTATWRGMCSMSESGAMMGIVVGLPLGVLLHTFVLMQIRVDMVSFKAVIAPVSFLLTVVMVVLFTVITDLVMRKKIAKIDMAESLKSIE